MVLSNLTLIHLSKFKSGWLPNISTIRFLQPLLFLSFRLPFTQCKRRFSSCPPAGDVTGFQSYFRRMLVYFEIYFSGKVELQPIIIFDRYNSHNSFSEPKKTPSVCLFCPTILPSQKYKTKSSSKYAHLRNWNYQPVGIITEVINSWSK